MRRLGKKRDSKKSAFRTAVRVAPVEQTASDCFFIDQQEGVRLIGQGRTGANFQLFPGEALYRARVFGVINNRSGRAFKPKKGHEKTSGRADFATPAEDGALQSMPRDP